MVLCIKNFTYMIVIKEAGSGGIILLMEESGIIIMGNTLAWHTAQSNTKPLLSYDGMKMELVEKPKNGFSLSRIKRLCGIFSPLSEGYKC